MAEQARVLLVIPCLDEAAHLPTLLPQMLAELGTDDLLVVVDGGSTDDSRGIVAALAAKDGRLHLLANPARRQAAGVNLAVRIFGEEARWLLRVDAHCGYPAGFVSTLVQAAARQGADCVVVPMVTSGSGCFQRAVAAAQNSKLGTGGSAHRTIGVARWIDHGHHALMDVHAFRQAGGYDESFSHNEDAELDIRLGERGARLWIEPAAAITYYPRGTIGSLWKQYLGYGGGRARTLRRHHMRMKLRQRLPLIVFPAIVVGLAALTAALFTDSALWSIGAVPAGLWAMGCIGVGVTMARSGDLCLALAGPAAMIMHTGWSLGYWRAVVSAANTDKPAAF